MVVGADDYFVSTTKSVPLPVSLLMPRSETITEPPTQIRSATRCMTSAAISSRSNASAALDARPTGSGAGCPRFTGPRSALAAELFGTVTDSHFSWPAASSASIATYSEHGVSFLLFSRFAISTVARNALLFWVVVTITCSSFRCLCRIRNSALQHLREGLGHSVLKWEMGLFR